MRNELLKRKIYVSSKSQIVSLEGGKEEITEEIRDELEARNIFGSVFCAPATPKNRSLLRFSITSTVTKDQLDKILSACDDFGEALGIIHKPKLKAVGGY